MTAARLAELREGVWARPENIDVVWPAVDQTALANPDAQHYAPDSNPGTWVSNQTGGPSLCETGAVQRA